MKNDSFIVCAPHMDVMLERKGMFQEVLDNEILSLWSGIYQEMCCIIPYGDDDIRSIWMEIPRGTIEDFGDFKEYKRDGIVKTRKEFDQMWEEYYPKESYWYKVTTSRYQQEKFFFLNSKLIFTLKETEVVAPIGVYAIDYVKEILGKLSERVKQEVGLLQQDQYKWNDYLEKNLTYNHRLGRIKRGDFLNILGDEAMRLDKRIGKNKLKQLKSYIAASGSAGYLPLIRDITADDFFRFCEICYEANAYFKGKQKDLTPREKYTSMADGRDAGLREIPGNSPKAFHEWYHSGKSAGCHPWEICRGGNSTHISLSVYPEKDQWKLYLAGSSIGRVEETVKMALALYDHQIPFILVQAEEIGRMVTGTDFIGLVPDSITPRYCHSLFPKEEKIIDFMNLPHDYEKEVISAANWYPLEKTICDAG